MAGGGLVVLVAAATIRPLGIAAIVVAFLAALLYGALLGEGRRSGA
jgi:hypothetical protein